MTSRQHQNWLNLGRPDSGLARPLEQLADLLHARGWLVYRHPNDAHLDAIPPEDHTYYSETGWPGTSPKWWRHAIDIMPDGKGVKALQDLGERIFLARQAGNITWLKYMNWPSTGSLSVAVQDKWEPNHENRPSSDTGHIHLSCITGVEMLSSPFDPYVAPSAQEAAVALSKEDILAVADAVVQWATVDGALPAAHLGARFNLKAQAEAISQIRAEIDAMPGKIEQAVIAALASAAQAAAEAPLGDVAVSGTLHFGGTS